ncbi:hypothetical protein EHI8A_128310 [Entamoeba histolytica HM-1:IMSS-B]|uniref:Uncharacterized protein n=6 Tax=Entamoeba histolytica TaxID=5759 RepID=C4M7C3_ENTH1|nr:hypothetical protein EHI_007290 [Entamoeba histolytica HM-1:IMSS]EMD43211.1 Hypothetical protein EHI5A_161920 [Entamoeba histolytica KU27]EMH72124.1 hypothetical protein EHI8A_128310 [Entamoeba histolytica HM-1:IMSS-B]EMS12504.1 hypothetical protein KM1_207330 [Entamoeba histolytica HM-3:IMSS]ENY59776.1 hypothetical protein EHI7A_116880 [Entamoeba histolytica HM-1:IMSS-A]GAT97426.1 hypothetical protein CL6EHI_007290 [Entamoeba histolytica]|eukprot:XP_650277.1 hypothetical protein EHI_007290 [Entamoeba histolytica HM-1:IMSS]
MNEIESQLKKEIEHMKLLFDSDYLPYEMEYIIPCLQFRNHIVIILLVNSNVVFGVYYKTLIFFNEYEQLIPPIKFCMRDNDLKIIDSSLPCTPVIPSNYKAINPHKLILRNGVYLCEDLNDYGNTCNSSLGEAIQDIGIDFEYFPDFQVHRLIIGQLIK